MGHSVPFLCMFCKFFCWELNMLSIIFCKFGNLLLPVPQDGQFLLSRATALVGLSLAWPLWTVLAKCIPYWVWVWVSALCLLSLSDLTKLALSVCVSTGAKQKTPSLSSLTEFLGSLFQAVKGMTTSLGASPQWSKAVINIHSGLKWICSWEKVIMQNYA